MKKANFFQDTPCLNLGRPALKKWGRPECSFYHFLKISIQKQATTEELGILPRIVNGITSAIGTIFNGGSILGAAGGNPLFGSIAIGRKKREIKTDLQILRERLIRTGMIRLSVISSQSVLEFQHWYHQSRMIPMLEFQDTFVVDTYLSLMVQDEGP